MAAITVIIQPMTGLNRKQAVSISVLGEEPFRTGCLQWQMEGDQESDVRNRHVFAQAADGGHLVAVHRMDDVLHRGAATP